MDLTYFDEVAGLVGVLGVKVTQHGKLLAYKNYDTEMRRNIYSASKSFTACAVGFAIDEGLLSLNERLTDCFADSLPETVSENLAAATVRDLLTMCLGQGTSELMAGQRQHYKQDDWVKLSLSFPFPYKPGTHFVYSNVGPYLAGMLVQLRAGQDLVDYLLPRLFAPLGIKRPTWQTDFAGNTFGASGLMLSLSELHDFGLLCLQGGKWNGRQIVNRDWLAQCTVPQDAENYGYLFWRGEKNSFRADGMYSQLSVAFPDRDAVVTVVAECRHPAPLWRAIYGDLYEQLEK